MPAGIFRPRRFSRLGVLAAVGAATLAVAVTPASAHVSVAPATAAPGAYTTLTFKVPNEQDGASTTSLDVQFPSEAPIASVSVQPKAGWDYRITKSKPARPLRSDDGAVDEVVSRITWTVAQGSPGIRPGEFDTFNVSAGPLPTTAGPVAFKALQTYSSGEVVRWVQIAAPGQPEPDLPAPTITITAASAQGTGTAAPADTSSTGGGAQTSTAVASGGDSDDGTARALGIAGVVLGLIAVALAAVFAVRTSRRQA
ncbi:YcnI family protein [Frankia sp. Ag45/Mut15]|uniref:YcnI family protein n=1 Tax=Frankia umida TaxID=573489 RepID=A0ABT0JU75_9ACTN|nr:YcnI family protein [Frankia umida]MCK9875107.1 YcnI family protein [Frankia umida]